MSSDKDCGVGKSCPQFKTTTFRQLWKRYTAMDKTALQNTAFLKSLSFPLLPSAEQDRFLQIKRKDCETLCPSQRQTWSMFKSFRKLFSVPVVYCDSGKGSEELSESQSGSDLMEKNYDAYVKKQHVSSPYESVLYADVARYIDNQTGIDRLKGVFEKDVRGEISPELFRFNVQLNTIIGTIFFTSMILCGTQARQEFIQKNKTTVFLTKGLATRRLMDWIFVHSIKGACKWTFKLGMFAISLLTISEGIAIYRNKTSPLEYAVGGGVTGSLVKFSLGPKGMFSGGVFGSLIGLGMGLVISKLMKRAHETQQDRHFKKIETLLKDQLAMSKQIHKPLVEEEDNRDYEIS